MGGISILQHFLNKIQNVNVIYYADNKNYPYGLKDEITIGNYLLDIYNYTVSEYDIKLIVIACNTASVSALNFLREKIDIPIIGTVPAVKVAAEISKNGKIGIIATETTVKLNYLSNLINKFTDGKEVFVKPSKKLVDAVENDYSTTITREIIEEELTFFKEKSIDTLVLGCTHYSFLTELINDFFENKVDIVDSGEGVSNRILNLMPKEVIENNSSDSKLILSYGDDKILKKYDKFKTQLKIFNEIKVRI